MQKLAFALGNFIMPKYMIKTLSFPDSAENDLVEINKKKRSNKRIVLQNGKDSIFYISKINCKNLQTKISPLEFSNDNLIQNVVDKVQNPQSKLFHISNDFFGYLKGMDLNEKKSLVLNDYKLIYRFSIGKLMNYISEETFLLILMQYLNKTQMHRIHQR